MTALPPLYAGGLHARSIRVSPAAVAVSPAGASGATGGGEGPPSTTAGTPPSPVVKLATSLPASS